MSNRSSQVVTLDSVNSLTNYDSKPIVWKDLGVYLDKKLAVEPKVQSHFSGENSLLSQVIKYKICKSCQRPIGFESLGDHYDKCTQMRNKKNFDDSDDVPIKKRKAKLLEQPETSSIDSSRNTTPQPNGASISSITGKPKKKYKKSQTQKEKEAANAAAAAAAAQDTTEKRKKKSQKPQKSSTKQKGPVDVEKQCGVPLPNGGFCARSLTCKTHSMGAKRMVPGRSAPYDVLLQQYQKRNQAKMAANNALALQKKENDELNAVNTDSDMAAARVLDPDDETYLVLEGLSKNQPIPLERKVILPVRNRHRFLYMRESYANALIINSGAGSQQSQGQSNEQTLANQAISGSIGGLQGRSALVNVDSKRIENDSVTQNSTNISGEMYQVRAPSKEIMLTAQHNAAQQQLFQQQIAKLQQQQLMLMKQRQKRAQQQAQAQAQQQAQAQVQR
ncbi:SAGA complex subunit Sgf73 [Yamadazyma tenuis]|uniref:SCA7-domain-containing protein n=1 Tax=Candida tenuis (strain ATCC 10573 / BCRC 21748 / CBS 615 / JCM 9827 / NBRC 10315 / NRRL Y-1498 / VKM Y-70) TaxID=590646 RepID=G3BAF9_CANTC|nr:SCA7-domain-containing protein [Yamadazyma tenuis ATCC 10573]EGV62050.1 SCA7-domain-containing protein [Yamadazyma tenuis ATCC 10573]WEJ93298.1 SAGA complex subunit Sgf73 [Yamadazyma tenuis]